MHVRSILLVILCLLGEWGGANAQTGDGVSNPTTPGITAAIVAADAQGNALIYVWLTSSGQAIAGVQFDIQYQDSISPTVALGGAGSNNGKNIFTSSLQPVGQRVVIVGLNQSPIGDGVIATISITLGMNTPAGLYPVTIGNAIATTSDGTAISLSSGKGGVVVPGAGVVAPTVTAVVNGASYNPGAVAPGEIVLIQGSLLGPGAINTLQITSAGTVASSLASTRVLFDGVPAPLIYTTQSQVSAVVPYEVDGLTQSLLQVEYQGIQSVPFPLGIVASSPGILTSDQSGHGQGAIINQDGTVNGLDHPAPQGSIVSVYGTGEGQTNPAGIDATIADPANPRLPLLSVAALIGGQSAEVVYAGSVGGEIAGVLQMNIRIPAAVPSGSVPLTLTIGDNAAQTGVTLFVQ